MPIDDLIYLCSCSVNGVIPDKNRIEAMDLESVYMHASRHMLTACAGMALESAGYRDERFARGVAGAIRNAVLYQKALGEVRVRLEEAGIWYMMLKGAALKDDYPKFGMREMSDHDILCDGDRILDVKTIMEDLGFETKVFGRSNQDVYLKPPVLSFEMHSTLFSRSDGELQYEYYLDVKDRLEKVSGLEYRFKPDDFYIYIIAHEYKHYSRAGTGLRTILDIYVFLKKYGDRLDWKYIEDETDKMELRELELKSRSLAMNLFGGGELSESDRETLDYVVSSGVYGTLSHIVENNVQRLGGGRRGRIKYLFNRLFLPDSKLKASHPFIYKHKILLPFFTVYRVGKALTQKMSNIKTELKALRRMK